ncbi:MAG TPA: hypothetical protein VFV57_11505 [Limnobacter sp.]|nr:hypothetical protein [Limnobacter sp.]
MDDFANNSVTMPALGELESKREWFVGVVGAALCYASILWLL